MTRLIFFLFLFSFLFNNCCWCCCYTKESTGSANHDISLTRLSHVRFHKNFMTQELLEWFAGLKMIMWTSTFQLWNEVLIRIYICCLINVHVKSTVSSTNGFEIYLTGTLFGASHSLFRLVYEVTKCGLSSNLHFVCNKHVSKLNRELGKNLKFFKIEDFIKSKKFLSSNLLKFHG